MIVQRRVIFPCLLLLTSIGGAHAAVFNGGTIQIATPPVKEVFSTAICVTGSLQAFIGLNTSGGCLIGDKTFTNFGFKSSAFGAGAHALLGSDVTVIPTNVYLNPGLEFDANVSAGLFQVQNFSVAYTATVNPGGGLIEENTLSLINPKVSGLGSIAATEVKCLGGSLGLNTSGIIGTPTPCTSGVSATLSVLNNTLSAQTSDHIVFAPVSRVDVIKSVTVAGGGSVGVGDLEDLIGHASLTGVKNQLSEQAPVPEPATMGMFGAGLLALGFFRRRKLQ